MAAFRIHFVSQGYRVRSMQHFTVPAEKTNQMLNEGSLVSEQLTMVPVS